MKAFTGGHVKTTGTVKLNLIDKVNKIGVLSALQEFQSKEWNCGDWLLLVTAYDAGHFLFLLFGGDDGIGATVLVIIFMCLQLVTSPKHAFFFKHYTLYWCLS